MARRKHTVELTGEQLAFLQTSLDYSAQRLRDHPYEGEGPSMRRRATPTVERVGSSRWSRV
jgi:hypothetical protein